MTITPSSPIPETAERRAAVTRAIQAATGLDESVLERLVRAFYETARQDEIIGHKFDGVQDWETHITQITSFWSSVALHTGRYQGQPLDVHFPLDLEPPHFRGHSAGCQTDNARHELFTNSGRNVGG
jgi:hemoglobin